MVDLFLVYKFIRKLVEPFTKWDAYKRGIIDRNGKILISRKKLSSVADKKAFTVLDVMILNIKKLLDKLPVGQTKLNSYAAALWLIREWKHFSDDSLLTEDVSDEQLLESLDKFQQSYTDYITDSNNVNSYFHINEKNINEEPAVNVGSGNIAGVGVGSDGEPGITKNQQKKYRKKNFKDFMSKNK